jgi:hypothetical protein
MSRWLRRFIYLLVTLVWLCVMSLPALAFILAIQGQIQMGNDVRHHLRIFMLQDPDVQGIGIEWTRPLRRQPTCSRTTVNYLLWEGEGEDVAFCQCYDPLTNDPLPAELQSCSD